jgi:hypothetical protein
MTEYKKWILASDLHFPKHDPRAIDLFLQVVKQWQPDAIDFAGDLDDAECSGRWVDGTPAEAASIQEGAGLVKEFLVQVSKLAKKAEDKHFHGGNHDYYRHKNYLEKKAPNVLEYINPETLYGLSNSGFEWHDYERPPVLRLGGIHVHHGESISKHSVESVRADVSNYMVPLIRGHSHRAGSFYKSYPLAGLEIEGYEIGHLTDPTKHTYQTTFDWQQAFAVVHVDNGTPHVNLIRIRNYVCYVDGKRFAA